MKRQQYLNAIELRRRRWLKKLGGKYVKILKSQVKDIADKAHFGMSAMIYFDPVKMEKLIQETYLKVGVDFGLLTARQLIKCRNIAMNRKDVDVTDLESPLTERMLAYSRTPAMLELITTVNETTKEAIRLYLMDGIASGLNADEIGKQMEKDLGLTSRGATIARTEIGRAQAVGTLEGAQASGVANKKEWITVIDQTTHPSHVEADGEVVGINEDFVLTGERLQYPRDPAGSPGNTINCRCDIAPFYDENYV